MYATNPGLTCGTKTPAKTIWMFWSQGWDTAPEVAQASLASWKELNPEWTVVALDQPALQPLLGDEFSTVLQRTDLPIEAYSDVLRIELLAHFGGVWADATTMCAKPLEAWLPDHTAGRDFFAFSDPGPGRPISSWFLYSKPGAYLISQLQNLVRDYWSNRAKRDDYFWLHQLFQDAIDKDARFKALWQAPPHISARQPFHFGPNSPVLAAPPTAEHLRLLAAAQWPVFKLTHKHSIDPVENTLLETLLQHKPMKHPK